ncbi:hypothetical protein R1flu_006652 [Riccia fluitans]|uniref:Uncharacterized protein n=1 Tax=Riccia fluitans TaxID=41844 RepID=A0ABD1YWU9_9MARC
MTKKREVGKNRVAEKGKKKQRVKMIIKDYDVVVTYIENLEHYRDITGGGKKTRIRGSTISKVRAFEIMASALSEVNGFSQVTGEEMKKRFVQYEKMYKDIRRWKDSIGAVSKDSQIPPGSNGDTMDEYIVLGSGESDAEEEVQVTGVIIGVEDNFVAEDQAKETFINLVDAKYGEDETFGDEKGEHFEHASGDGSEINELVQLQNGVPQSIPRIAHAESGMLGKENVAEDSNASGFYKRSKDTRSQMMVLSSLIARGAENLDVLNGIAWDKEENKLYVTGKMWPKVFQIRVVEKTTGADLDSVRTQCNIGVNGFM